MVAINMKEQHSTSALCLIESVAGACCIQALHLCWNLNIHLLPRTQLPATHINFNWKNQCPFTLAWALWSTQFHPQTMGDHDTGQANCSAHSNMKMFSGPEFQLPDLVKEFTLTFALLFALCLSLSLSLSVHICPVFSLHLCLSHSVFFSLSPLSPLSLLPSLLSLLSPPKKVPLCTCTQQQGRVKPLSTCNHCKGLPCSQFSPVQEVRGAKPSRGTYQTPCRHCTHT